MPDPVGEERRSSGVRRREPADKAESNTGDCNKGSLEFDHAAIVGDGGGL